MSLFRYSKIHSFHSFEDKDRVFAHFREQIPYLIAVFLQLQTSYEIRGSDLRLLKSPSVGSTGERSTGPFSYAVSPRLALIFFAKI